MKKVRALYFHGPRLTLPSGGITGGIIWSAGRYRINGEYNHSEGFRVSPDYPGNRFNNTRFIMVVLVFEAPPVMSWSWMSELGIAGLESERYT